MDKDIETILENLGCSDLEEIGHGGSATIYSCKRKLKPVAIRVVKTNSATTYQNELRGARVNNFVLDNAKDTDSDKSKRHIEKYFNNVKVLYPKTSEEKSQMSDAKIKIIIMEAELASGDVWKMMKNKEKGAEVDYCTIRKVGADVLKALKVLHGQNKVHFDIKPENIYTFSANPKKFQLGDVGLLRGVYEDEKITITEGSPEYLPPDVKNVDNITVEQAKGIDIYALGITLLQIYFSYKDLSLKAADAKNRFDSMDINGKEGDESKFFRAMKKLTSDTFAQRSTADQALKFDFFKSTKAGRQ